MAANDNRRGAEEEAWAALRGLAANDNFSAAERAAIEESKARWAKLGYEEPRTESGNPIVYVSGDECRSGPDGTEKRMHIGSSREGFHAALEIRDSKVPNFEPYKWGNAHPTAEAATEAAWKSEEKNMAEIPDNVKAEADAAMAKTGAEKMQVKDMDAKPSVDAYDTKAMEAAREQQRQTALENKTPAPSPEPDKG